MLQVGADEDLEGKLHFSFISDALNSVNGSGATSLAYGFEEILTVMLRQVLLWSGASNTG